MLEREKDMKQARKELEEIEEIFTSGKIKTLPPAELRYLMEDYESLQKSVRHMTRLANMC